MRILIVEDEHMIGTSIKKGLEQEHYAVDLAFRGNDGLDLALSEEYDVIILDRLLPEMDGIEICRTLRKKNIHTPVLMLTAKGQVQDRVEGLDAGADDYLLKPFSFEELLARIRALIRRPTATHTSTLTVADLTLDTMTYEVKRDGKVIKL
ncbi:MAG TPA: response regulator transcription factor, partial [Candidatus Saccharimonadia bacterium]|nr:response regulator transcription factor [Candidatus Saccharimonadia bacterium]